MNNMLQFIWWLIFLGPIFKVVYMMKIIFSINAEKELKLSKNTKWWVVTFIAIFGLLFGAEQAIHGFTLTAYILIVIAVFLIIFLISNFLNNKLLYTFLGVLPLLGFLGYWTGVLSIEVGSPFYLELIIITIPFILPYLQYKLIFKKSKLIDYVKDYLTYIETQSFQNKEIRRFTNHLEEFIKDYTTFLSTSIELKNMKKQLSLKILNQPKKTDIFKNQSFSSINKGIQTYNWIVNVFSEALSLLFGGRGIAGSDEESIIKAIGHFNNYLVDSSKQNLLRLTYIEFTKGKCEILEKVKNNYYLMFYLKYVSDSQDYVSYFKELKRYGYILNLAWNERKRFTPLNDFQKESIDKFVKKIEVMEKEIKNETKKSR